MTMNWNDFQKRIEEDLFLKKSQNTAKAYISDLRAFGFTDKPSREAVRAAVLKWKEGRLTGKTIVRRFAAVRWVLKTYPLEFTTDERFDILAEMQDIETIDKEQVFATRRQVERLIRHADERTALCIAMMYYAGLRVSEVARSKLKDWDIYGKRPKSRGHACLYVPIESDIRGTRTTTKNKKEKVLPILPELLAAYERYMAVRPVGGTALLIGQRGEIVPRTISSNVRKACEECGYHDLHDHSFRHGLATMLAKKGVSSLMIASLMGHKSLSSTQKYVHYDSDDKARTLFKAMGE